VFYLTTILTPTFTGKPGRKEALPHGKPLSYHLPKGIDEWVIYINRKEINLPVSEVVPVAGDEVVAVPVMAGGDREQTRMFAGMAIVTASIFLPNPWGAILMFGASLVNSMFPPKTSKEQTGDSYSWRHSANRTAADGGALPVIYGKTRVKPTIKNRFITTEGDKQYLNVLYSFCGHEIDQRTDTTVWTLGTTYTTVGAEVTHPDFPGSTFRRRYSTLFAFQKDPWNKTFNQQLQMGIWDRGKGSADITDILINGNPIENYPDIVYETRPGLPNQTQISLFNGTYSNEPQGTTFDYFDPTDPLYDDTSLMQTVLLTANDSQNLQVDIQFPDGIFTAGTRGQATPTTVMVYLQYKKAGMGSWTGFNVVAGGPSGKDYVDTTSGYLGGLTKVQLIRNTTKPVTVSFTALHMMVDEALEAGQYYVRVGVTSEQTAVLLNISSVVYDGFAYPGEVLLGLRALASGQLSSDFELTGVPNRSTVKVYDPDSSTWVDKAANLHPWSIYDLLTAGHADHPKPFTYGAGIDPDRINYDAFNTWAAWLASVPPNNIAYSLNIVFDSFMQLWDAILRICEEGRGMVTVAGAEITCVVDKAETPVQLFSVGNIIQGSFNERWVDQNKVANSIEATFFDISRDYARTLFSLYSTAFDTDAALKDAARMYLHGVTTYAQAYDLAAYRLLCNIYQKRIITFDVAADALAADPGDVIKIQHDVPIWGNGGRVVKYWATHPGFGVPTVQIDKQVTIAAGTYELEIRATNGTIEKHAITNSPETTEYLTFTDPWTITPVVYDLYAFGLQNYLYSLARITSITRTGDMIRTITAIDYNSGIYGAEAAPTGVFKPVANIFNPATGLTVTERQSRRTTGEYQSNIDVSFLPTDRGIYGEWAVYIRDVSEDDQNWLGEWNDGMIYATGEKVIHNGYAYISLIDDNIANEPFLNV